MDAEPRAFIKPAPSCFKSRPRRELAEFPRGVFVRIFGPDRFPLSKEELVVADRHGLSPAADQMHFDPAGSLVIKGLMPKEGPIEAGGKVPICARQQVQIEGGGDSLQIIIGAMQGDGM